MNDLDRHVLAYYVANGAEELNLAGRFYPKTELVMIVGDKIGVVTRKFGRKVAGRSKAAAAAFVDHMIEKGAFTTKQNDFGGTMHQFQTAAYKQVLGELRDSDPVVAEARSRGETDWSDTFAALTG